MDHLDNLLLTQMILKKMNKDKEPINYNDNIQSVLIPKNKFTLKEAIAYIKKHFNFIKLDVLQRKNYYSFRQHNPIKGSTYSTIKLKNGVLLVMEYHHTIDKTYGGALSVKTINTAITNGYQQTKGAQLTPMPDGFLPAFSLNTKEVTVYINKNTKHIIVNFVGTYNLLDWGNNAMYVAGLYNWTRRFNDAKKALEKVIQKYPDYKITLVGHSQGGILTRKLNEAFPSKIYEIINLNPASLHEKVAPNEYNIRSDLDIVSALQRHKNIETIHHTSLNPISEHLAPVLNRLDPNKIIGRTN